MILTTTTDQYACGIGVLNILEDEALHTFFDLKAELAYHSSMPNRRMKRDRYDITSAVLVKWFGLDQSRRCAVLDEYVVKKKRKATFRISAFWDKADDFFATECLASVDMLKAACFPCRFRRAQSRVRAIRLLSPAAP